MLQGIFQLPVVKTWFYASPVAFNAFLNVSIGFGPKHLVEELLFALESAISNVLRDFLDLLGNLNMKGLFCFQSFHHPCPPLLVPSPFAPLLLLSAPSALCTSSSHICVSQFCASCQVGGFL
jgi:hypothetical protein